MTSVVVGSIHELAMGLGHFGVVNDADPDLAGGAEVADGLFNVVGEPGDGRGAEAASLIVNFD